MNDISLSLTAAQAKKSLIKGSTAVVIDVLRASSVIITALANGAEWVLPVAEVDEARKLKKEFTDAILGGERDAVKLPGFNNGNSPFEYSREKVEGKGVILTTTNGTQALAQCKSAGEVLIGAFINLSALAERLLVSENPVHLLCAGTRGEFSMDDFLCAGAIISKLSAIKPTSLDDLGVLARSIWENKKGSIADALKDTKHYNTLLNRGFQKDLEYCLSLDLYTVVPTTYKGLRRLLGKA